MEQGCPWKGVGVQGDAASHRNSPAPACDASIAAMSSMRHECLVDLFKNRPSLAAEILSEALGLPLPP